MKTNRECWIYHNHYKEGSTEYYKWQLEDACNLDTVGLFKKIENKTMIRIELPEGWNVAIDLNLRKHLLDSRMQEVYIDRDETGEIRAFDARDCKYADEFKILEEINY